MRRNTCPVIVSFYVCAAGKLILGSLGNTLCLCDWVGGRRSERNKKRLSRLLGATMQEGTSPMIDAAKKQLDEYFAGKRTAFNLPLTLAGTAFQKRVWERLTHIAYGSTVGYGEMARQLGCPTAVRAVANAIGANALSIFLPCHRVVGANGSVSGYAGGIEAKRLLLDLEQGQRTFE